MKSTKVGILFLVVAVICAAILSGGWIWNMSVPYSAKQATIPPGETQTLGGVQIHLRSLESVSEDNPIVKESKRNVTPGAAMVLAQIELSGTEEFGCGGTLVGKNGSWFSIMIAVNDPSLMGYCNAPAGTLVLYFEVPPAALSGIKGIQFNVNKSEESWTVFLQGTVKT